MALVEGRLDLRAAHSRPRLPAPRPPGRPRWWTAHEHLDAPGTAPGAHRSGTVSRPSMQWYASPGRRCPAHRRQPALVVLLTTRVLGNVSLNVNPDRSRSSRSSSRSWLCSSCCCVVGLPCPRPAARQCPCPAEPQGNRPRRFHGCSGLDYRAADLRTGQCRPGRLRRPCRCRPDHLGSWGLASRPDRRRPGECAHAGWVDIPVIVALLAMLLFRGGLRPRPGRRDDLRLLPQRPRRVSLALARSGLFSWIRVIAQRHRRVLAWGLRRGPSSSFTQNGSDEHVDRDPGHHLRDDGAGPEYRRRTRRPARPRLYRLPRGRRLRGATMSYSRVRDDPLEAAVHRRDDHRCLRVRHTRPDHRHAPTLRVSGDHLAIVTLAFREIFRLAMFNLDGNNRAEPHPGPERHPGDPGPRVLRVQLQGIPTSSAYRSTGSGTTTSSCSSSRRSSSSSSPRLNNSRIGRGWVAIREDEKAAEAMGVNTFGLKALRLRRWRLPGWPRRDGQGAPGRLGHPGPVRLPRGRPSSSRPSSSAAWGRSRASSSARRSSSCSPRAPLRLRTTGCSSSACSSSSSCASAPRAWWRAIDGRLEFHGRTPSC